MLQMSSESERHLLICQHIGVQHMLTSSVHHCTVSECVFDVAVDPAGQLPGPDRSSDEG